MFLIGAQNNGGADGCVDSYGHRPSHWCPEHRQSYLEGTRASVDCGEGFRERFATVPLERSCSCFSLVPRTTVVAMTALILVDTVDGCVHAGRGTSVACPHVSGAASLTHSIGRSNHVVFSIRERIDHQPCDGSLVRIQGRSCSQNCVNEIGFSIGRESVACPHVSGAAALNLSADPIMKSSAVLRGLTNNTVKGALSGIRGSHARRIVSTYSVSHVVGIQWPARMSPVLLHSICRPIQS